MMQDLLRDDILIEAKDQFINGNYKVAEPILQQLILQNSRNPEVFQMLATIYYDKGQFSKAIKTFERALEIDPTYTDASVGLSIILNDLGRYEDGKKVFLEAKGLLDRRNSTMDTYVQEKIANKHEELADLYFQYNRFDESLEQLMKANKLSTRRAEIGMRMVECYIKMGEEDRAIKDLKTLIRELPYFNQARLKLGTLYFTRNDISSAVEQWENVLLRDPKNPEALKNLKLAGLQSETELSY